jgi:hypothetical protein
MILRIECILISLILSGCSREEKPEISDDGGARVNGQTDHVFRAEEWGLPFHYGYLDGGSEAHKTELIQALKKLAREFSNRPGYPRFPDNAWLKYAKVYSGDEADPSGTQVREILSFSPNSPQTTVALDREKGFETHKIQVWLSPPVFESESFYEIILVTLDTHEKSAPQACKAYMVPKLFSPGFISFKALKNPGLDPVKMMINMVYSLSRKTPWICSVEVRISHLSDDLQKVSSRAEAKLIF